MKRYIFTVLCLIVLFCFSNSAEAADKYVFCYGEKTTVNGVTVEYKDNSIVVTKKGKRVTVAKKVNQGFVTNGKNIFYVKNGNLVNYRTKTTIYKYNIKSKKKTKIKTGLDYVVLGCSGKYLYYGSDCEADGVNLCVLNLKSGKSKSMANGVSRIYISDGRVVTEPCTGAPINLPIYSFKKDGTDKKTIAKAMFDKVKNGKVYYTVNSSDYSRTRKYVCSVRGTKKKALTGWKKW